MINRGDNRTFILADSQEITRRGIASLLRESGLPVGTIREVTSEAELAGALKEHPTAVVVVDMEFGGEVDERVLHQWHARHPQAHWLLFEDHFCDELLHQFCSDPSFSFVLKRCELNEISAALKYTCKGESFICNPITRMLLHYRREPRETKETLTATEKEILRLIALGRSAKEIACERHSSVNTVITHKKNIFRKLEVNSVYEATKYALRAGLIDTVEYYI